MEALVLAIVKAMATTFVKMYMTGLMAGSNQLVYDKAELGYKVPKWYLNPGEPAESLYAYGTSIQGDEFASIEDAKQRALEQMANSIRLANQKTITEKIRYDKENVKQQRLVELFMRSEGLEDFIRQRAAIDKQQLVKVKTPQEDMRAFVRIAIPAADYLKFQEDTLHGLKRKLLDAKSEDIMDEVSAEAKQLEEGRTPPAPAPQTPGGIPDPKAVPKSTGSSVPNADATFNELERATAK